MKDTRNVAFYVISSSMLTKMNVTRKDVQLHGTKKTKCMGDRARKTYSDLGCHHPRHQVFA